METLKLKEIDTQALDRWFANITDKLNYNLSQIQVAVPALADQLSNIDTSPVQYLKNSLNGMVKDLNDHLAYLRDRLDKIEAAQGGK